MPGREKYSAEFRANAVRRMRADPRPSTRELARELGVSSSMLYRWAGRAMVPPVSKPTPAVDGSSENEPRRPEDWSPEERLSAVIEASNLPDGELGRFLRTAGLHEVHLREWKAMAIEGLRADGKSPADRRVKELEQAVVRREKALAEAAMLLLQEKKLTSEPREGRSIAWRGRPL